MAATGLISVASGIVRGATRIGTAYVGADILFGRGRSARFDAGIGIDVRSNIEGEITRINRIVRDHDKLTAMVLNTVTRKARTKTTRELAAALNVPQKVLRKRIRHYQASARRKPVRASLWVGTKRAIKAQELGGAVSQSKTGYVKVGKRVFRNAFPARMPGGHQGIFSRKLHARHKRRADGQMTQLPIEEAVVQLMPEAERISRRHAERAIKEDFPKEQRRIAELKLTKARF